MTRDDAVELILARLGQRQNDAALQAAAVLEMNLAQKQLERGAFKPWFLLSELRDVVTEAGEERIALPTDYLQESENGALWLVQNGVRAELRKTDYDLGLQQYPLPGVPKKYSLNGRYLRLHPTPDDIYSLQSQFFVSQPQITVAYNATTHGTDTNAWLTYAEDWLIAETGKALAATYTRDTELAAIFGGMAAEARTRIMTETVAREEVNYQRSMGDD